MSQLSLADAVEATHGFDEETPCPDLFLASLRLSRRSGDDPWHILRYVTDLGAHVTTLEDLAQSIDHLADEDELSAVWVSEGLLVQHASDGWFLLYVR